MVCGELFGRRERRAQDADLRAWGLGGVSVGISASATVGRGAEKAERGDEGMHEEGAVGVGRKQRGDLGRLGSAETSRRGASRTRGPWRASPTRRRRHCAGEGRHPGPSCVQCSTPQAQLSYVQSGLWTLGLQRRRFKFNLLPLGLLWDPFR